MIVNAKSIFYTLIILLGTYQLTRAQSFSLVRDICQDQNLITGPDHLTEMDGKLFFNAYDIANKLELWCSRGDSFSTRLVKNIHPTYHSNPTNLTAFNNQLFFAADDGTNGIELWVSDGTQSGTTMLIDINPGALGSAPDKLTVHDNKLYFVADDGTVGRELWVTDGTSAGTYLLKDIDTTGSSDIDELYSGPNYLYFAANDNIHGNEPWRTDGTASGTIMLKDFRVASFAAGSDPHNFFYFNGFVFFSAEEYSNTGFELCRTDGTPNLVQTFYHIEPAGLDSRPGDFIEYNNELYFVAGRNWHRELWKTNGVISGTKLVRDIDSFSISGSPQNLTVYNGKLYFSAEDTAHGRELWETDGTYAGTQLVFDINPANSSNPKFLTVFNNNLYMTADDGNNGEELWRYGGSMSGMTRISPPISVLNNPLQHANALTVFNQALYFNAHYDYRGIELWRYGAQLTTSVQRHNRNPLTISPNPSRGTIQIKFTKPVVFEYELLNLFGQKITSGIVNSKDHTLDVTDQTNGIYLLALTINGTTEVHKISLEH